jgi:thiamine pyrophosphokinase
MRSKKVESVLIIANGKIPKISLVKNLVSMSDCIIAADGGSNYCYKRGIYPHFIVGDLDSVQVKILSYFKDAEIIRLSDQNSHDLEKAIIFAKTFKPKIIRVVAAFGKRVDHSLANLILLQSQFTNVALEFYDNFGKLSVITKKVILNMPEGTTVSLFSFLPLYGLSLIGFKYPIKNRDFTNGFTGLSNIISSPKAQIKIREGFLFIYTTHDNTSIK